MNRPAAKAFQISSAESPKHHLVLCRLNSSAKNPYSYNYAIVEDLGLGALAASVRLAGHRVTLLDAEIFHWNDEELLRRIFALKADAVGFGPLAEEFDRVKELAVQLRRRAPDVAILLGDHYVTLNVEKVATSNCEYDWLFTGEADLTLPQLMDQLGKPKVAQEIPGILPRGQKMVLSCREQIHVLDQLPNPERDVLAQFVAKHGEEYDLSGFKVNILGSRGCPGRCSFCSISTFYGEKTDPSLRWRPRSPKRIVKEMESIAARYGITNFIFFDDNFIGTNKTEGKHRLKAFAIALENNPYRFHYSASVRPDSFRLEDRGLLEKLRDSGLRLLFLGVEAGNSEQLRLFRKGLNLRQAVESVRVIEETGLTVSAGFIMFTPYSTREQLTSNAEALEQLNQSHFCRNFSSRLHLYPGIPLCQRVERDGLLTNPAANRMEWRFRDHSLQSVYETISRIYETVGWACDRKYDEILDLFDYHLDRLLPEKEHAIRVRFWPLVQDVKRELADLYPHLFRNIIQKDESSIPSSMERLHQLSFHLTQLKDHIHEQIIN